MADSEDRFAPDGGPARVLGFESVVALIESLAQAPEQRGIRLMDSRFREEFHSYRDIHGRVREMAAGFLSQGLQPGEHVLVAMPTELDSVCAFLGLIYMGAIPFTTSSPLLGQSREAHRSHVVRLITLHGIDRVLASRDLEGICGSVPEVPASREIVPRPEAAGAVSPAGRGLDQLSFVQFSSGSTSHPKGVQITHRNLLYNLGLILETDRRTEESVWVSWLPLYHDMGLIGGFLTNLVYKNDLVLMPPLCFVGRPISWLDAVSRHRGTVTAIPNFALDICSERIPDKKIRDADLDLSSFRFIYNGAEPVRVSSLRRFESRFRPHGFEEGWIYPVYGMSEATLIISAPRNEANLITREVEGQEIPSVGYPLGDFEVEIRDEEGNVSSGDAIGEICIRGTAVTPGYLLGDGGKDSEGWLPTGDLGFLDEEGRLYVTGRKKDLIIHEGRNYYGHDIAARVEELPYVRRGKVFVFSLLEEEGEERVIVLTAPPSKGPETPSDEEAFAESIQRTVQREFGLPVDDVLVVPRIPKTTSGKVARHRCEEIYRQHREGRSGD